MVQTFDISNLGYFVISINSLKHLRSMTLDYKDIEIRKSEFVAKTQLLLKIPLFSELHYTILAVALAIHQKLSQPQLYKALFGAKKSKVF